MKNAPNVIFFDTTDTETGETETSWAVLVETPEQLDALFAAMLDEDDEPDHEGGDDFALEDYMDDQRDF